MKLPAVSNALQLSPSVNRLYIGAYGFEDRSLGWATHQMGRGAVLSSALFFRYTKPKGKNRVTKLRKAISVLGVSNPTEVPYDYGARFPGTVEEKIDSEFSQHISDVEEVVLDISAMSKLLILISLCKLS